MGTMFSNDKKEKIDASKAGKTEPKEEEASKAVVPTKPLPVPRRANPDELIYERPGSQYIDEYGCMGHDFVELYVDEEGKTVMKQVTEGLTKQGMVPYDVPRLKPTFPFVVAEL